MKETLSSIYHNKELQALQDLEEECGSSSITREWRDEMNAHTAGGCWFLTFGGTCAHPQYGQCDGARCVDIEVRDGRSYYL